MAVTAAMIAEVSPYSVDDETAFSKATFARLSAVAKVLLDRDNPGLTADLYDYAHALMICHLYDTGKTGGGALKSESIGSYSYSKDAGASAYLLQYRSIMASYSASQTIEGQERSDADMGEMHLDQSEVPEYGED
jgi:hypothetical protein